MSDLIKILVIDDESVIRTAVKRILEIESIYNVTAVESGREGLELLAKETFDLVLLDIKMPDVDGLEVSKIIFSINPEQKVIIMSGYSTAETSKQAVEYGASDFIEKPFTPDQLLKVIKKTVSNCMRMVI
ncbi:MAG TPA: response regulator [Thermodesulfovibrionia bacterium]|nr:response regulator [Thermodesulfovibrionia bacterium]